MIPAEGSAGPVRNQLEKILSSPEFIRNDRLSKFLRFVVEQRLEGKAAELKESLVGIEVFGRRPGFDPRQDSVVRTEAAKLRARLSQYYASEGAADAVVIELPKGGYTPVFREAEEARERPLQALRPPRRGPEHGCGSRSRLWVSCWFWQRVAGGGCGTRPRPFRSRFCR